MKSFRSVVILGTAYPFRGGGISTYNERLAKAYQEKGDKVIIYTFSLQYPSFLFPGKTQYSTELAPENLTIKIAINSINPFNWIKIGRELKKLAPDLLIIRYWIPFMAPCLGVIARITRTNKKTKAIAITDNIIPHEKMPGGKLLSHFFVRSCDGFLAMSRSVLNDLRSIDNTCKSIYNPHPLYDNFGEPIEKAEAKALLKLNTEFKYILFFGFIREYKGLDLLITAFADKRFRDLPIKVLVAGEFYVDSKPYLQLIQKYSLEDKIELHTSFIPNTDIVKYFCASDIVAQPYKDATQSGVTQVAYHFNKPMLTTNVGGLSEMVPDGIVGYVVEPESGQIADALYRYFAENKEAEFTQNVLNEKKRFSWDILLESIDKLIEK